MLKEGNLRVIKSGPLSSHSLFSKFFLESRRANWFDQFYVVKVNRFHRINKQKYSTLP